MARITGTTTIVDQPSADRTDPVADRLTARTLTVAIRAVTPELRRRHFDFLPLAARWVAVAYDSERREFVWLTDADPGVGNLVVTAWMLAYEHGARFVGPEATCGYCGLPVDAETEFCPPTLARDCAALHSQSEAGFRLRGVDLPLVGDAFMTNVLSGRDLSAAA